MRRTQKQTQYIRMTKDRLNPMPPAMRRLLDERDALQASVTALTDALETATDALETARRLWFNALFDQGTPRELHVIWFNEWLAKLDAAGG